MTPKTSTTVSGWANELKKAISSPLPGPKSKALNKKKDHPVGQLHMEDREEYEAIEKKKKTKAAHHALMKKLSNNGISTRSSESIERTERMRASQD